MPPGLPTLGGDLYNPRSSSPVQEQLRPDLRHHGWAYVDSSLGQVDALGTQGDECQEDEEVEELVGREDKRIGPGKEGRKGR